MEITKGMKDVLSLEVQEHGISGYEKAVKSKSRVLLSWGLCSNKRIILNGSTAVEVDFCVTIDRGND